MVSTKKMVMATVYLKSVTGFSLLKESKSALQNPKFYLADEQTVQQAVYELEKRGFTLESRGAALSISGAPELFEKHCQTKISLKEVKNRKSGHRHVWQSSEPVMYIQGLEDIIDGIVLAVSGVSF